MGETDKPFACPMTECGMRFTNEDHLTVHKKKHDMCLNFGNGQKMNIFADQTPTPTRFIRNCEEVGLFQDLQNVNPFEEQFRKAAEAAKSGTTPLHEVEPMCGQTDDTLHTPQVFSHIEHHHQHAVSVTRVAESSPPPAVPILQPPTPRTRNEEHFPLEQERVVPEENRQTLRPSSVTRDTSVQLLLRLPDGKVVKLSAVEMAETEGTSSGSIHSSNLLTAPSVILDHPTNSGETARTVILSSSQRTSSQQVITPTTSRVISTNTSDRMALAKQRLKQALSANRKKESAENNNKVPVKEGKTLLTMKTRVPERLVSAASPPKRTRELSGSTGSSGEDTQVKRQKFLERNRAAASRCRQKRKHWINTLERRADIMHSTNQQLVAEVGALREEVAQLKTLLLAHRDCSVTKAMCQSGVMHVIETSTLNSETTDNSLPNFVHNSEPVHSVINLASTPSNGVLILQSCAAPIIRKNQIKSVKQPSALSQPVRPLAIPVTRESEVVTVLPPKSSPSQICSSSQSTLNNLAHNHMTTNNSQSSRSSGVLKFVRNIDKETVIVENVSKKD